MYNARLESLMRGYKNQELTERQIKNRIKKVENEEQEERTQKPIKSITLNIEWKNSRTWGSCPNLEMEVNFQDGTYSRIGGFKASGCGYDKESTVIANALNSVLRYKAWEKLDQKVNGEIDKKNIPYGIRLEEDYKPYFEGGVGTNCYYHIVKFLDGKMEDLAHSKNFNCYRIEF